MSSPIYKGLRPLLAVIVLSMSGCEPETNEAQDATPSSMAADVQMMGGLLPDVTPADLGLNLDAMAIGDPAADAGATGDSSRQSSGDVAVDLKDPDSALTPDVQMLADSAVELDALGGGQDSHLGPPDADLTPVDVNVPAPDVGVDRSQYPEGPYGFAVGDVIVDLEFIGLNAAPYRLSDMRQEPNTDLIALPVLVMWCPVCARQMPALGVMAQDLREEGVLTVLSIFENDRFDPANHRDIGLYHREHNPPFALVADPDQVMAPYFESFGRQKYLLIDADSMEIVRISESLMVPDLQARIRAWLGAERE